MTKYDIITPGNQMLVEAISQADAKRVAEEAFGQITLKRNNTIQWVPTGQGETEMHVFNGNGNEAELLCTLVTTSILGYIDENGRYLDNQPNQDGRKYVKTEKFLAKEKAQRAAARQMKKDVQASIDAKADRAAKRASNKATPSTKRVATKAAPKAVKTTAKPAPKKAGQVNSKRKPVKGAAGMAAVAGKSTKAPRKGKAA